MKLRSNLVTARVDAKVLRVRVELRLATVPPALVAVRSVLRVQQRARITSQINEHETLRKQQKQVRSG